MNEMHLSVDGQPMTVPGGSRFLDVARQVQDRYAHPILLAMEGNRLRELTAPVAGHQISFLTGETKAGNTAYQRSLSLMMQKAVYDAFDTDPAYEMTVHFAVGGGLFYTLRDPSKVTDAFLDRILWEMQRLHEAALPFEKRSIHTTKARELFHTWNMPEKENLFRYRLCSRTNIYELGGVPDYSYGYLLPDTSYLSLFDLKRYREGFVLRFPLTSDPSHLPEFAPVEKLFDVQDGAVKWGRQIGIDTVADVNDTVVAGKTRELILTQEAYHEAQISQIAAQIVSNPKVKIVLIAGPSSSGKTTFSHRLSTQLSVYGFNPHPIPMDDYFVDREKTPRDAEGNYDFECLEAIDVKQFQEDMQRLLDGEEVELPTFNFKTGKREYKGNRKQLGAHDILVIEGIHGLNDALTGTLPKESRFRIYISALTQLNIDEHNRIPTTDGRLLRRIVRDARTRGTSAAGTIAMWPSVRRGEEKHIFPYQHTADVMFNSALIYELAVLKLYAQPLLFGIAEDDPAYPEAKRLLKFMDYFVSIPAEGIPQNSLVREFVGGSCFDV